LVSAAQQAKNGAIYGPLIPTVGGQAFFGGLGGGMNSETGHFGESEDYVALVGWRIGPGGLLDFGNMHAQQARLRSAALTANKVTDQIANEVITSQARVQSLAAQIATAKQSLSDAAEALRLAQERKEFGVGVVLETILAQQEVSRVRNDYLNIVTEYDKAQYELLRALGRLSTAAPR
jgi:outer membrane protein TolC